MSLKIGSSIIYFYIRFINIGKSKCSPITDISRCYPALVPRGHAVGTQEPPETIQKSDFFSNLKQIALYFMLITKICYNARNTHVFRKSVGYLYSSENNKCELAYRDLQVNIKNNYYWCVLFNPKPLRVQCHIK